MIRSKRFFVTVLAVVFVLTIFLPGEVDAAQRRAKRAKPYRVSAKSAVLFESDGLRSLYQKSPDRKVLPASTTKVMTALIVFERLHLDDVVTISQRAAMALPSKIDVKAGERFRVRDLLYAALLNSANDASIALAEAAAGSEDKFVDLMNRRARQLGAKNTLFANAHGLPSEDPQYTTAYDMVLIFREAMNKPFFREAIQSKFWIIKSEKGRKIPLKSHNKALFKGWKENIYGKTGYTNAAQACFVGSTVKNKKLLIIAVFGCSQRWEDVKFLLEKYGGVDL